MVVVDTSVWVDFFNGNETKQTFQLERSLEIEEVVTGDLIMTELLQGFRNEKDFKIALDLMSSLIYKDMMGEQNAIESAKNYMYLRKKGVMVRKTIDVMIGTFCIMNHYPLLHCDSDFNNMEKYLKLKTVKV